MRYYDYKKAKELIKEYKKLGLITAELGMKEDWYWTAETVWEDGKYTKRLNDKTNIGGINRSTWATPILKVETKDNSIIKISCYYEQTANN